MPRRRSRRTCRRAAATRMPWAGAEMPRSGRPWYLPGSTGRSCHGLEWRPPRPARGWTAVPRGVATAPRARRRPAAAPARERGGSSGIVAGASRRCRGHGADRPRGARGGAAAGGPDRARSPDRVGSTRGAQGPAAPRHGAARPTAPRRSRGAAATVRRPRGGGAARSATTHVDMARQATTQGRGSRAALWTNAFASRRSTLDVFRGGDETGNTLGSTTSPSEP